MPSTSTWCRRPGWSWSGSGETPATGEDTGLLIRAEHPADPRAVQLRLTEHGTDVPHGDRLHIAVRDASKSAFRSEVPEIGVDEGYRGGRCPR
jgi:hypothetical protein